MDLRKILRRTLESLSFCLAAGGTTGCSGITHRWWPSPASPAGMPTRIERTNPATENVKPDDAVEDSDDRHPSRWRQKLRVRYS